MRSGWVVVVLFVATLIPTVGMAQVYQFATPPPQVTAASAEWQINGVPIQVDGVVYQPTALVRPFDRNVMTQVGVFDGVPVYADATLEPYSILYVPVARGMRTYERIRSGNLADTTGSRTPSFPVEPDSALRPQPRVENTAGVLTNGEPVAVGTSGSSVERGPARSVTPNVPARRVVGPIESLPLPRTTDGVWIRYDGAKWYSDGEATSYSAERFTQIGTYAGFPVYRERNGNASRHIWVAAVKDGPLTPYVRR